MAKKPKPKRRKRVIRQKTKREKADRARDVLVDRWLDYARLCALRSIRSTRGVMSDDEMLSVGGVALLDAINTFDEGAGASLKTYISRKVYWAILNHIRSANMIPFRSAHGRRMFSIDYLRDQTTTGKDVGTEYLFDEALIARDDRVIDRFDARELIEVASRGLTKREKRILKMLFLQNKTAERAAKEIGITAIRVFQIRRAALNHMREALRMRGITGKGVS